MQKDTGQLNTMLKEAFQFCFQQWKDRWEKWVAARFDYFKRDYCKIVVSPCEYFLGIKVGYFLIHLQCACLIYLCVIMYIVLMIHLLDF